MGSLLLNLERRFGLGHLGVSSLGGPLLHFVVVGGGGGGGVGAGNFYLLLLPQAQCRKGDEVGTYVPPDACLSVDAGCKGRNRGKILPLSQ